MPASHNMVKKQSCPPEPALVRPEPTQLIVDDLRPSRRATVEQCADNRQGEPGLATVGNDTGSGRLLRVVVTVSVGRSGRMQQPDVLPMTQNVRLNMQAGCQVADHHAAMVIGH